MWKSKKQTCICEYRIEKLKINDDSAMRVCNCLPNCKYCNKAKQRLAGVTTD